jgi:two-component system response regulator HydG
MSNPIRVLVIDDEESHALTVAECLERVGYECQVAFCGSQGSALLDTEAFDIVITDLVMDDLDGLTLLRKIKRECPETEVLVISAYGTVRQAVQAMEEGAHTYLTKPLDLDELRIKVGRAAERVRMLQSNAELRRQLDERFGFEGVIGNSPKMRRVLMMLQQIAPTSATVLIEGETGTGKELVAKAIHNNSPRKHKRFVAINCAAFAESLIESELFGHEKGAFTGADRPRIGTFEYAHGGTLFLDEVGDMPLATQVKLLRVIEQGEIVRVGSNEPIRVNVRIISATNQSLEDLVAQGKFRPDLYYRLKVTTIRLPALRERLEDIPLLTDYFLKELSTQHGKQIRGVTPAVRRAFMRYEWPGNVRELRNVVESMIVVDWDGVLDVDDLQETGFAVGQTADSAASEESLVGKPLEEVVRWYIQKTLELTQGNREQAAKLLKIGERTLYRKIQRYGLGRNSHGSYQATTPGHREPDSSR